MNDEMNIMNDNWKMEEMKHERRYESEIEYRAVRAYEKVKLDMLFDIFVNNPSPEIYMTMENQMVLYQDIVCNCTWKRGDE
tara:strand:- start:45 stop:287 length:243 start_codon:yes stop_codon:yes gene_type:complete